MELNQTEANVQQSQIELVKNSFKKVEAIADAAAALFYGRLFELDPSLRALFKGDLKKQGRLLMQMIATAVRGLDRIDDTPDPSRWRRARRSPSAAAPAPADTTSP